MARLFTTVLLAGLAAAAAAMAAPKPAPHPAPRPAASAHAPTMIRDPRAFVADSYRRMAANGDYSPPDDIYTPRLRALFALEKHDAGDEIGRMEFDFWSNSQDPQITEPKVTQQEVEGGPDRRIVIAHFKEAGTPQEIHFYFQKVGDHWLLDDARSFLDDAWTLSLGLKYGFDSADEPAAH